MSARRIDILLVIASWALVAIPAWLVLSGGAQQAGRWLVLATALPLLGLLVRHVRVSGKLARRNRALAADVSQMELAEELAGVGRWCIEVTTRAHKWSEEMCAITGLKAGTAPDDAAIATIFPEGLAQLEATTYAHRADREPFAVEFEIANPEKGLAYAARPRAQCLRARWGARAHLHGRARRHRGLFGRGERSRASGRMPWPRPNVSAVWQAPIR